MKKVLTLASILALAACCPDYDRFDSMFSGCERIQTKKWEKHLLYKCPADQEWLQEVKNAQPNGKWRYGTRYNLDELYTDTEHVYVEVALYDRGVCKEDFTVRTMIAQPVKDGDDWAFIECKY